VLDHVNRRDGFSMKKQLLSSARSASFHTKQASNVNVVRVVLLDANSYLAYRRAQCGLVGANDCKFSRDQGLTFFPKHGPPCSRPLWSINFDLFIENY
jgi:hypothetical protein